MWESLSWLEAPPRVLHTQGRRYAYQEIRSKRPSPLFFSVQCRQGALTHNPTSNCNHLASLYTYTDVPDAVPSSVCHLRFLGNTSKSPKYTNNTERPNIMKKVPNLQRGLLQFPSCSRRCMSRIHHGNPKTNMCKKLINYRDAPEPV